MTSSVPDEGQPLTAPNEQKMTNWAKEPSVADLKQNIQDAQPHQNKHTQRINTWLDNMHVRGSAAIKPIAGRSSVQPKLIRKHAEWRYADLSEPFLSSDKIFSVAPRTHEDRPAAEQNEQLLNYQFDVYIDKVDLVDQYVRTAVDEGSVVVRTGWNRETQKIKVKAPVYSYFSVFDPEKQAALKEGMELMTSDPESFAKMHPEAQESIRYSIEKQGFYRAQQTGEEEIEQEKVIANHPTAEIANIFNLVIDPTCGTRYDKAMFMAYSMEMRASDLAKDKRYKNLKQVDFGHSPLSEPDHQRPGTAEGDNFNFADNRKLVVVQEYWGYYDIAGDDTLVPFVAAWIGNVMVRLELNPFPDGKPPFVIVPLLPLKKSPFGEPDGELLIDSQKIIGAVTRGMLDIMARSANAQRGMAKSMLDVVNKRRFDAGLDYEFNPNIHPSQGVVEHKFPEIPNSAPNMITMMSMEAESLTGVKTYGGDGGINGSSLGPTAAGVKGVLSATGRRTNGILRRMAKGMASVGKKIVAMNQVFLSREEVIRITNEEFVTIKREDIQGFFDLKVDIATAEEDEAKAGRLEFMLQTLGNTGNPEVTLIMQVEIARLRRMPDLAYKLKNFKPTPDPLMVREQEAKIRKLEAEAAEMEAKADLSRAQAEKARAEARLAGSTADKKDLEYVEQETGTQHARDVDKISAQARANTEDKITQAILGRSNGTDPSGKEKTAPTNQDIAEAVEYNARQS